MIQERKKFIGVGLEAGCVYFAVCVWACIHSGNPMWLVGAAASIAYAAKKWQVSND